MGPIEPSSHSAVDAWTWKSIARGTAITSLEEEEGHGHDEVGAEQLRSLDPVRAPVERDEAQHDRREGHSCDLDAGEDEVHRLPDGEGQEHEQRRDEECYLSRRAD